MKGKEEDLTQAALVMAWLAWSRLDGDPEAYVRKIIVNTHLSPVSEDQLRQLLAERSEPARSRPAPTERITARIRRARMKRAAAAGSLHRRRRARLNPGVLARGRGAGGRGRC